MCSASRVFLWNSLPHRRCSHSREKRQISDFFTAVWTTQFQSFHPPPKRKSLICAASIWGSKWNMYPMQKVCSLNGQVTFQPTFTSLKWDMHHKKLDRVNLDVKNGWKLYLWKFWSLWHLSTSHHSPTTHGLVYISCCSCGCSWCPTSTNTIGREKAALNNNWNIALQFSTAISISCMLFF